MMFLLLSILLSRAATVLRVVSRGLCPGARLSRSGAAWHTRRLYGVVVDARDIQLEKM
jgi:hypothetical protein